MKPELSIIIVSFNTRTLTEKCVKSIISSNLKVNYEIIVVDNGSKNGTAKALKKFDIKVIENKENLGFAKANNQGIRTAKGEYFLLLNSDTEVKDGSIDKLYEFAISSKDAGVVGPRLLNPDGSIQHSVSNLPTILGAIMAYWFGDKVKYEKYAPSIVTKVPAVMGAAFLITPLAIKKVGLLDERYFMYYEDLDYCRRVRKSGLSIYYLPASEIIHHHGFSGRNLLPDEIQWRRLIPSSKIYHGLVGHYLLNFIIWSGQKWQKLLRKAGLF